MIPTVRSLAFLVSGRQQFTTSLSFVLGNTIQLRGRLYKTNPQPNSKHHLAKLNVTNTVYRLNDGGLLVPKTKVSNTVESAADKPAGVNADTVVVLTINYAD